MPDTPVPPPHGWTLTEAAAALDPEGWHEANFDENRWAADPRGAEAARNRFHDRFARMMATTGDLSVMAVDITAGITAPLVEISPHICGVARFHFQLTWYPPPPATMGIAAPVLSRRKPDCMSLRDPSAFGSPDVKVLGGVRVFAAETVVGQASAAILRGERARIWVHGYLSHAKEAGLPSPKRDDVVMAKRCIMETKCTVDDVRKAYSDAPRQLRNLSPKENERGTGKRGGTARACSALPRYASRRATSVNRPASLCTGRCPRGTAFHHPEPGS